ncbi:MAG: hypothetical protein RLZZ511_2501 [Cyanobacteriota bacterium]
MATPNRRVGHGFPAGQERYKIKPKFTMGQVDVVRSRNAIPFNIIPFNVIPFRRCSSQRDRHRHVP